jgi:polar amino acid transport system permease protein
MVRRADAGEDHPQPVFLTAGSGAAPLRLHVLHYTFQFGVALASMPALLRGALLTLQIALLSFWGGALIGLAGATARAFGGRIVRGVAATYVVFFTNTPALLQIYFLYYGLPEMNVRLSPLVCVVAGLTLNAGAYLTDIMRGGFVSVRRTELDAAAVLGMSLTQQLVYVIIPHVVKTLYPALANFFILLVLGSSLGAVFSVDELTGTAIDISTETYRWIEMFVLVAGIYIVLTFVASLSLALVGRAAFRVRARVF